MDDFLIIDCLSICHSVKHSTKRLTFAGNKTGIIFGFMKKLLVTAEETGCGNVVFSWDTQGSLRREIYPEYKANRHVDLSTEDELLESVARNQFDIIRTEMLPNLGFENIFGFDNYEADDVIATAVKSYPKQKWTIATRDNDMWQLLSPSCRIYDHVSKHFITEKSFKDDWNLDPPDWALVKAIAGCSTDNVAGVYGVGNKTAAAFLKGELKPTSKKALDIIENYGIVQENLSLVHLPFDKTLYDKIELVDDKLSVNKLVKVCETYGFESMLNSKMISRWKAAFNI